jgi:hypothetical protein
MTNKEILEIGYYITNPDKLAELWMKRNELLI